MMQSEIVCGRQMSACASTAAAWLVATQKDPRPFDLGLVIAINYLTVTLVM